MAILGQQGKTCCDILHAFTVPKSNEQGTAGLPVSCLGLQGGKTGKTQFPGAAGESGQDDKCPLKPEENARYQTVPTKPRTDQQPQGCKRARATPCSRNCLARPPRADTGPRDVPRGALCWVLRGRSQSLYICTSYQCSNIRGEGHGFFTSH